MKTNGIIAFAVTLVVLGAMAFAVSKGFKLGQK